VKEVSMRDDDAAELTKMPGPKRETGAPAMKTRSAVELGIGPRINPDNTFRIEPVDPDDLPDFENLTRRRSEG
jgi:hypothetical protein